MLFTAILFLAFQSAAWLVSASEVQQLLDTYCELILTLTNSKKGGLDRNDLAASVSGKFEAHYHDFLDCSWDTGNPIMGYNIKIASYEECLVAKVNGMSHGKRLKVSTTTCTEIIADETKGTGSFWTSASIAGKDSSVSFAGKIKVVDGKIAAYHIDFDTYVFLSDNDQDEALREATGLGTDIGTLAVGIILGAVISMIISVSVVWKRNLYVRLDD